MPDRADSAQARSRTHGALAAASRVRILRLLREHGVPLDIQLIAAETGLHPNTVRFHLEVLVDAGLATGRPDPRGGAGRPRLVFSAATSAPAEGYPEGYELLAGILASYLAETEDPARVAEEAGRAFARRSGNAAERPAATAEEAARRVNALFAELGFEPELDGDRGRILLHECPFRSVAQEHPDVVCAMHLGLLKQALDDVKAPSDRASLDPFVTPHLCVAHLPGEDAPTGGRHQLGLAS